MWVSWRFLERVLVLGDRLSCLVIVGRISSSYSRLFLFGGFVSFEVLLSARPHARCFLHHLERLRASVRSALEIFLTASPWRLRVWSSALRIGHDRDEWSPDP